MAIQGTQVPIYTNTHCFCYKKKNDFSLFILKNKTIKQKYTNNIKAWKQDANAWKQDVNAWKHDSKVDKKSSKESSTLDRKN